MTVVLSPAIRRAAVAIATAALLIGQPAVALADRGVRIDAGRVDVNDALAPGQTYHLPTLGVSNPGDEPSAYTMDVNELAGSTAPDASWFEFAPATFDLAPGQTQPVEITLRIPTSAEPGQYTALVVAQIGSGGGSGVGIGAAAATRLVFTVEPASELAAALNALGAWLAENRGWLLPSAVVLGIAVVIWFGRRHLAIEIRRR